MVFTGRGFASGFVTALKPTSSFIFGLMWTRGFVTFFL